MARTAIPIQVLPKNGALDDLSYTAGDAANDHEFQNTGRERLIMKNADASGKTADVISVADEHGRTGDITMSPAATSESMAGPFKPQGIWNQAGGLMHVDLTIDTNVSFAVVRDA